MKNRGIKVYLNNKKSQEIQFKRPLSFEFVFDYGPRIDAKGTKTSGNALVKFIDKPTGQLVYQSETSAGMYISLFRKWFYPWIGECYIGNDLVYRFDFEESLTGGKIGVSFDSASLGDTLAWIPVIHKLKEKYNCDLYVTTFWNDLLSIFYPDIRFFPPGYREKNTNAVFGIGWYDEADENKHKRDPRTISLQQVAGDHIGFDFEGDILFPEVPDLIKNTKPTIEGKYVCIAIESTANAKHWHYPYGWQSVVDYVISLGYTPVLIQKQPAQLHGILDKSGEIDILQRAIDLYHCEFFIGIGSGLSWLAWALHKPVIMISGFSLPKCEFSNKNYRVINKSVCHGCFNDPAHFFDRGDWNWCPRLKETPDRFICTTSITPKMVYDAIDKLIEEESL